MSDPFDSTDPALWLPELPMEDWEANWVGKTCAAASIHASARSIPGDPIDVDWFPTPHILDEISYDHDLSFHQWTNSFMSGDPPTAEPQSQIGDTSTSNGVSEPDIISVTSYNGPFASASSTGPFGSISCTHPICVDRFSGYRERDKHVKQHHPELLRCDQCRLSYEAISELETHTANTYHAAFSCPAEECDSKFGRIDVMKRHCLIHTPGAKRFPCPHCSKYKGKFGFKRMDHLMQHLRGYHHIGEDGFTPSWRGRSCPHTDCLHYRGKVRTDGIDPLRWQAREILDHAFKKPSDWTKHMKEAHDESLFPCPASGCNRVRRKGYFRELDLVKHMDKEHPGVEYAPERDSEGEELDD